MLYFLLPTHRFCGGGKNLFTAVKEQFERLRNVLHTKFDLCLLAQLQIGKFMLKVA